jgi:hypothetical protein
LNNTIPINAQALVFSSIPELLVSSLYPPASSLRFLTQRPDFGYNARRLWARRARPTLPDSQAFLMHL